MKSESDRSPHETAKDPRAWTRRNFLKSAVVVAGATATGGLPDFTASAFAQTTSGAKPSLYLIATAHNDTQWNWTVQNTILEYVPATMHGNWDLFKKYPLYNFNYEGVIHYMFFKEYHPEEWGTLQDWVKKGRWKLSGSWINAVDVNIPSPESLFRQALYGQRFYRREFQSVSRDIFLPDCFGFPYSLPTIARHSGLISFSSQKLSWGCFIPAPFAVGRWEGPDGSEIVAELRPGNYNASFYDDIADDPDWNDDLQSVGDKKVGFRYYGTGDQGGTPAEESVYWANESAKDQNGSVRVISSSADQLAKDLTPEEMKKLPHYKGELVMKTHGVGCYTSQAAAKKWNRMGERFGDAAERASLAAEWLGGPAYPRETLYQAWIRLLWHQFHDDLTGTSIPQAYTFTWNDQLISLSQFSQIVATGVGAIAQHLDARTKGVPLVVYNPLERDRKEAVEATIRLPSSASSVRVYDAATGKETPSQILSRESGKAKIVFLASVPSVGAKVYDARSAPSPCDLKTGLSISKTSMESDRYRVSITETGDIGGVFDKKANVELLKEPSRLERFTDISQQWPAWEVTWEVVGNPPDGAVKANPRIEIEESGPARISLKVTRNLDDSVLIQRIRLAPGVEWVEVDCDFDWRSPGTLVKAAFPMTASAPKAVFDLGLGTIERPNASANLYEVNAQKWAGITDSAGGHGMAILTQFKYGWDKPSDNEIRLTLIRTPYSDFGNQHQITNDIGRHRFAYALAGHAGDWRKGGIPILAERFNQPMIAFQTAPREGKGGRSLSLLRIASDQVAVSALKKAEDSDEWVIRLIELHGQPAENAKIAFAAPVVSAREIDAIEDEIGKIEPKDGALVVSFTPYQPRSFAVKLAPSPHRIAAPVCYPLSLAYDLDGVSMNADRKDGAFDDENRTYPGELWPAKLTVDGIAFQLGSPANEAKNALRCKGQTITLPTGERNRLYLLAAASKEGRAGEFVIHRKGGETVKTTLKVQHWKGLIGQWDSRLAFNRSDGGDQVVQYLDGVKVANIEKMKPGFVKRDEIAYVFSHRHAPDGDLAYLFGYFFKYRIDLPKDAVSITLPDDESIRIFAMTAGRNPLDETAPAGATFEPEFPGEMRLT